MKRNIKLIAIKLISISCILNSALAKDIVFPATNDNTSYKSVTELSYRKPDEKVRYGDGQYQYGWFWRSTDDADKSPVIVLIHGGCWLNAFDVKHSFPLATALNQLGFNVWSIEYSRTGDNEGGWPGTYYDIEKALKKASHLWQNDLLLLGHSAGGHLALLAAAKLNDKQIKGVIGLAAISDIKAYSEGANSCQSATAKFMGGDAVALPTAYQMANPVNYPVVLKTWLLQGDSDTIVPMAQADRLPQAEKIIVAKAGHFDWIHPGSSAFKRLAKLLKSLK
ncbi:MAG: alpha/beta hydrolase [Kangiellaceae bacterium]|jgi:acetyl esterase/lipase|nr:alpha/beta hydrolase [Kangiellaceae bacterium]